MFTIIADLVVYVVGCGHLVDELVLSQLLSSFVAVNDVCVCVCVHAYMYMYIHRHAHTHTHTDTQTHTHTHTHTPTHTRVQCAANMRIKCNTYYRRLYLLFLFPMQIRARCATPITCGFLVQKR